MKLLGRDLSLNLRGRDVARLHLELRELGLVVPDDEVRRVIFGRGTLKAVTDFQKKNGLNVTGIVDEKTVAVINRGASVKSPRIVKGAVTDDAGHPLANLSVAAFDKDLRNEKALGQSATDKNGRYQIRYTAGQFRRGEKDSADLILRVSSREKVLATSEIVFNARPKETIDFQIATVEGRQPEFEKYLATIGSVMEDVAPADLTEADIEFVAGQTGIPHMHLGYLAVAHQHAQTTRLNPELLYGLFRQDHPTDLAALSVQQPALLHKALDNSVARSIISAKAAGDMASFLSTLQRQRAIAVANLSTNQGANTIGRILGASGLNPAEQETFLTRYLQHEGPIENFWQSLQNTPLGPRAAAVQQTIQFDLLTQSNGPLQEKLRSRNIRSAQDLPKLSREELEQIVSTSSEILAAIPPLNEDEKNEQKAKRYVNSVFDNLHATIPTAFVKTLYERSADPIRKDIARVLERKPDIDLVSVPLNRLLAENPRLLEGVADVEAVKSHLKKTQRVMRVAGNAEHAEILMAEGLDSANAIASLSVDAFEEQFAERLGGTSQARAYHERASQVNDYVLGVMATVKQGMTAVNPSVIAPVPSSVKDLPNFSNLFGSQSLCACSECNSVLSPAAYLVDLLQMINPKSRVKPIEKLRQRRPDIEHIPLTCENTNTELPCVDLVNEILEFYVAHNQTLTAQAARDTKEATAQELSINPQYVIASAYEALAEAVYPLDLPFDRGLEMARLYLNHLGVTRRDLMDVFGRGGEPTRSQIDAEGLGISKLEARILTGDLNRPLRDFYGDDTGNPGNLDRISVVEFLRMTGISYDDLVKLLAVRNLNPNRSIHLEDSDDPPRCNPEKIFIKDLTPEFWNKAHRFIRLARRTGWSYADLDLSFRSLDETEITEHYLAKLSVVKRLQEELKLPLPVLFSFWASLDVTGPDSLYSRLFLNKTVVNPLDPAFELAALSGSTALIRDHAPAICAALRIDVDGLKAICRHLNLPSNQAKLSLASLSAIHRHTALAKALKLKVDELLSLLAMTDDNPFATSLPTSTRAFVEIAKVVQGSGFKITELDYIYRRLSNPLSPLGLPPETVSQVLKAIHSGLRAFGESQVPDSTVDPLRPPLVKIVGDDQVDRAIAVVYGSPALTESQRAQFINKHFGVFLNPAEAQALLFDPATTQVQKQDYIRTRVNEYERQGIVAQILSEHFKLATAMTALLIDRIVKSKADPARRCLDDFLALSLVPQEVMNGEETNPGAAKVIETARKGLVHVHKIALLLDRFKLGEKELAYLSLHASDFGKFDLNALPVEEGVFDLALFSPDSFKIDEKESEHVSTQVNDFGKVDLNARPVDERVFDSALFADWLKIARYVAFAHSIPQGDSDLIDVFSSAHLPPLENPRAKAIEELKKATAWDPEEVDFLTGPNGLNLDSADDFKNQVKLQSVLDCVVFCKRLGVSSERLFEWSTSKPTQKIANEIVAAAKAKYSDDQWLTVAKPLNDIMREAQKERLLSAILTTQKSQNLKLTDTNRLFEHFLLDVDMTACGKTSRIKQAISSVQLFIQRCLMNMEQGVSPSAIDADHWEWMKNYRVWEANRKIFLYPENWIEPELRDDKSPFFKQLETELLQNDLTLETAEQAFVHYLEKLDEVSHLQICGLYNQQAEDGEDEVTHVFGRTISEPHAYYYRRFIDKRTWTAWEKLQIDIEGDHVFPVVHNRRLYLFWLQFTETQSENQELPSAYLQSIEHWKWLTKEHPEWKEKRQAWLKEHDIRAIWKSIESLFSALKDVKAEILDTILDTFIEKYEVDPTTDEEPEPREPEEPAFTTPPVLTDWEIKLAWSEYQYGRWSAKKTSSETVKSPYVSRSLRNHFWEEGGVLGALLLGAFNEEYELIRAKENGELEETIFTVFLPPKESHFVRTWVAWTGNLVVGIYRRYSNTATLLELVDLTVKGYDELNKFLLHCGNKVDVNKTSLTKEYDSLLRPEGSTNSDNYFRHFSPAELAFKSGGKSRNILQKIPSESYSIVKLHQTEDFRLSRPYQNFFYQDEQRAYYVTYHSEFERGTGNTARSLLNGSWGKDSPMIESLKKRSMTTSSMSTASSRKVFKFKKTGLDTKQFGNGSAAAFGLTKSKRPEFSMHDNLIGTLSFADDGLQFTTYFHPHICEFVERLYTEGVAGLLERSTQQLDNDRDGSVFAEEYEPTDEVAFPYPREDVDFDNGPYALYNWELFFHIPMFIAISLCKNQRFEEAVQWFHFVFNPTTSIHGSVEPNPLQRFWKTLPFFENTDPEKDQIQELLLTLAGKKSGWKKIQDQIDEWRNDPFNPHLIARMRITSYQKNVVMKYIENLISWGDQLFSRDTLESINEATLLYVIAGNLLGPRPQIYPSSAEVAPKTYKDISGELDAFSNVLLEVENELPVLSFRKAVSWSAKSNKALKLKRSNPSFKATSTRPKVVAVRPTYKTAPVSPIGQSTVKALHFCVPDNENMLACWDTVADRLFKIRHCMNIEGVVRELPLFEPPIDPALLVKARAAGIDLGSVLNDLFAPPPRYRYSVLVQKANELCSELKSLGGALLSALEKKDSEELSALRARQETVMLRLARDVKQLQIDEQKANIVALNKTRAVTELRYNHYRDISELSANEREHMDQLDTAHDFTMVSQGIAAGAAAAHLFPDSSTGTSGWAASPVAEFTYGGSNIGSGIQAAATVVGMVAAIHSLWANSASVKGGYERRWDEWKLNEKLASQELTQIDKQILAAEIRQAIVEQEILVHDQQVANSLEVEEYLRSKYTNEDLYSWTISQISKVYFQTYKLAYDLAKRAERAYRFELGLSDSDFIQFGYWDSLKKGLLAGEQLGLDLKRMESTYLEQNKREFEITRHISLVLQDPMALIALKENGTCRVKLPESLFDADYPGHYLRRIKSVSLTIPCIVGPYTSINCTLTLLNNRARITSTPAQPYHQNPNDLDDPRFILNFAAQQSIATSHAQNDSGVFELNFRDERYLPFEGAGAVSEWQIDLPKTTNAFDFSTISDVVLHLKYTARDGGETLRSAAWLDRKQIISEVTSSPLARLFSLKTEFSNDWHRFLHPNEPQAGQDYLHKMTLDLTMERFPFIFRGEQLDVNDVTLFLKLSDGIDYDDGTKLALTLNEQPHEFTKLGSPAGDLPSISTNALASSVPVTLEIKVSGSSLPPGNGQKTSWWETVNVAGQDRVRLKPAAIQDIWLCCSYSLAD